eukprot:Rhum_TRINITY_DN15381_c5_g1::Rhum_TRINITY_DN15381_c5_g1_i1::g.154749::m.154749
MKRGVGVIFSCVCLPRESSGRECVQKSCWGIESERVCGFAGGGTVEKEVEEQPNNTVLREQKESGTGGGCAGKEHWAQGEQTSCVCVWVCVIAGLSFGLSRNNNNKTTRRDAVLFLFCFLRLSFSSSSFPQKDCIKILIILLYCCYFFFSSKQHLHGHHHLTTCELQRLVAPSLVGEPHATQHLPLLLVQRRATTAALSSPCLLSSALSGGDTSALATSEHVVQRPQQRTLAPAAPLAATLPSLRGGARGPVQRLPPARRPVLAWMPHAAAATVRLVVPRGERASAAARLQWSRRRLLLLLLPR